MKKNLAKKVFAGALAVTLVTGIGVQTTSAHTESNSYQQQFINLFGKKVSNGVNKKTKNNISKYSGQTLFEGLLLGQGPVSKLFPEIWTPELLKKVNTKTEKNVDKFIIKEMNKLDPSFFNRFKEQITSGNQLKIDKIMKEGSLLFEKVLEKNKAEKRAVISDSASGMCMVGFQVYTYALYVQIGGAVETVVAVAGVYVYAGTKFWGPKSAKAESSSLEKDIFVDTVANRLSLQ